MPPRKKITTTEISPALPLSDSKRAAKETNQSNLEQLRSQVTQQINALFDTLIKEVNSVESTKKKTEEELELQKRLRKQEEEEQNFNLLLNQKKKQAEFDEELEKERKAFSDYQKEKQDAITIQKENLEKQEKEFKDLKSQVESFPQKLEKAIENTRRDLTTDLKKDFETEKKLLVQKYESGIQLFEQRINSLQIQIKQLERENQSLKDEKTNAVEQVKELAIAVVKGKEKEPQLQNSQ